MNKRSAALLTLMVLLVGCASQPVSLNHYMLHPTEPLPESEASGIKLSITQLVLPDYLRQRGLAYQVSDTKIQLSTQHLWAEPLQSGIEQTLERALYRSGGIQVIPAKITSATADVSLALQFDDFIATYRGNVVLSGKYWLETGQSAKVQRFHFALPQNSDGYESTVMAMRAALDKLAEHITTQLQDAAA